MFIASGFVVASDFSISFSWRVALMATPKLLQDRIQRVYFDSNRSRR